MASGRDVARLYADRVRQWIAERDGLQDFMEYERGGKVNRAALCAELDFGRSVVSQNPAVRRALSMAEERWYGSRISALAGDAARERAERRSTRVQRALGNAREQIAGLKAENVLLRQRLGKYEALEEILVETGRLPRT